MRRSSRNCGARAMTSPSWSTTKECPSKMSSSWPPTRPQKATAQRWSRARWAIMRSRTMPLPATYGEAEMLTTTVAPARASQAHRDARLPDVLADRQPDRDAVDLDDRGAGAALEVADLVEDAVVRQVDLAVVRLHRSVGEDRGGVVDVQAALGVADDRDDAGRVLRDALDRRARVGEEVLLQQQVLGRVAGDRQLGEEDHLGSRAARAAQAVADLRLVAGDVADDGVDLGQRDAQGAGHVAGESSPRRRRVDLR